MTKKVTTIKDSPKRITISDEQINQLSNLKDTPAWFIAKEVANNYILNLMKVAFKLDESSQTFVKDHARLSGEALGIKKFIAAIDSIKSDEPIR